MTWCDFRTCCKLLCFEIGFFSHGIEMSSLSGHPINFPLNPYQIIEHSQCPKSQDIWHLKSIKLFFLHLRQGSSLAFAFETIWWQKIRNVKDNIFHEIRLKMAPIEKTPFLWPFPSIARRTIEQSSLIVIVTQTPRVYLITDTTILSYFLSFLAGQRGSFFLDPRKSLKKVDTVIHALIHPLVAYRRKEKKHASK